MPPRASSERHMRLAEIDETERTYVNDLRMLVETHMKACATVLSREEMALVFGNLKELYEIHKMLASNLEAAQRDDIAEAVAAHARVFVEMAPFLRAYTVYCKGYHKGLEFVSSSPKLAKYRKAKPELPSLLIKPVQRLCKYPLLFEALREHVTGDTKTRLEKALEGVRTACEAVNEGVASDSEMAKVVQIYTECFDASPDLGTLVTPARRFLARGPLSFPKDENPDLTYFLFNDLLLLAKKAGPKFSLHHRIALVDLDVKDAISLTKDNLIFLVYHNRTGGSYSRNDDDHKLKLQYLDKLSFTFESPSGQDSDALRATLLQATADVKSLHSGLMSRRNAR
ncbi:hypothetical protein CTAYLR_006539 [Chrysophaeum taylorii]|uniref:DH domain-containing protein n=1 Tax=Chrysophaeum taylorii TaxID=2483200 RepID=A0AAD7XQ59_9STRA|nr:hypothetical protein CTAYLR_006539 [Chrysophaeum taylorii]